MNRNGYFGKIPSRSDFIKAAQDIPLMAVLDDWLAQVMSSLPADARWKLHYDALAPMNFAFVGPRRKHAVAGHVVASRDQSGRRYPFLMMRTIDVADPAGFVSRCPLVLDPLWCFFESMAPRIVAADDPAPLLHDVTDTVVTLDEQCQRALSTFLATATVGALSDLLGRRDVRELVLALGLLLQPVMHAGSADLDKSLVLPLPENADARHPVATFWLELIAPFLRGADLDLALFTTRLEGKSVLVVGFCDAAARTVQAIIDPLVGEAQQVSFADTGWVHDQMGLDVDFRALASYLEQPQLPLKLARELFLQTFIGVTA